MVVVSGVDGFNFRRDYERWLWMLGNEFGKVCRVLRCCLPGKSVHFELNVA